MAQELHDSRPWGDFIRRGLEIWWCSAPNEDDPPALEARRRIIVSFILIESFLNIINLATQP